MRLRSTMRLRSRSSWSVVSSLGGSSSSTRIRRRVLSYHHGLTFHSRRGKRRVKRSCTSEIRSHKNDIVERFVPVALLTSLSEMTCAIQNTEESASCSYYRCTHCPQAFCTEEEYAEHVRTQHSQAAPPEESRQSKSPVLLKCHMCKYTAPDTSKAILHETLHADQKKGATVYKCKICGFLSCSKMGITIHKRLEHAPMKYECPMCNYSSFNARHVTAHVDKVHCNPTEDALECPYCSAQFTKGHELKVHMQEEHLDESQFKEFTCDLCDYVCYTNTDIVHHMKAHRAKKKLFKCPRCLFISVKFDKYAKHLDQVHDLEGGCTEEEGEEGEEEGEDEDALKSETQAQPNIPVIRVIQKKESDKPSSDEVDINNVMYTPPTSPHIKSGPGNIFDKINLKVQEKDKVCKAVGLRQSPRKKFKTVDTKPGKLHKVRLPTGLMARKSLKRCRYCTTKTMFDTLTKLREHHIKAHGISDLGVQLGMRQYKCKYCSDRREFEGLQALKDHYAECHPASSIRKLVKRSRSQNESNESVNAEPSELTKIKPSLLDQIEIAETSCETKRQDMLDCILQSQKQIGKALKDSSPECNLADPVTKTRVGRINSAPSAIYDKPPSVRPLTFESENELPFKSTGSAPPTPLIPPATLDNSEPGTTTKNIPDYLNLANLGGSIYNLSLAELQYLQQCYIYQAYCMNMYYTDPIYRQYVHDKQRDLLLERRRKEVPQSPDTGQSCSQQPIIKISDPRSLAQPSPPVQPTVGLELTKPKLSASPPRVTPQTVILHRCFATSCTFKSPRLLDLKNHVTEQHNIRITDQMMSELEQKIRNQETLNLAPPPKMIPNVTISSQIYKCTHCNDILNSFDSYVQHLIESHRSELGIVSQGSMPNTFNAQFTSPPKTRTSDMASPNQLSSPSTGKPKLNLTSPKMSIKPDVVSPSTSNAGPSTSTANIGFECTSCYYVGATAEALKKHEIVHTNTYHKCSVCEYIAPSEGTLSIHMNVHKT